MTITLDHADLGKIKGSTVGSVAQFLGLKYASLENRFATASLLTEFNDDVTDATRFGEVISNALYSAELTHGSPPPISPVGAVHGEFGFIQHSLPLPDVPNHSDTEGLNLNITVPLNGQSNIDPNARMPVYVFIHGGGFAVGSNWYPHYDPRKIVQLSLEKNKPMIGITINYRLGVAGFMTSTELRKAGYKANNGLRDQRTALEWVRKFIGGFGGNPDEITTVGESAGGLSVTMLLLSRKPLMKRCFSLGGTILLLRPLPESVAEATYQHLIEALGLAGKSSEERIQALLTLPADDLWQKIPPNLPLLPSLDGDIVPVSPSFPMVSQREDNDDLIPGRKWCAALAIGDSQLDGNIFAYTNFDAQIPGIAAKFIECVGKALKSHPNVGSTLLSSYRISPSTSDEEALLSIIRFASEIGFYLPVIAMAEGWPKSKYNKVFLWHFNEGIPWEGRFKGEAGHILDVAYLFQNYNEHLSVEQKAVARAFGEDFIEFVNGDDPWPPTEANTMGARVYGPSSEGITTTYVKSEIPAAVGRGSTAAELGGNVGHEKVREIFLNFLQTR